MVESGKEVHYSKLALSTLAALFALMVMPAQTLSPLFVRAANAQSSKVYLSVPIDISVDVPVDTVAGGNFSSVAVAQIESPSGPSRNMIAPVTSNVPWWSWWSSVLLLSGLLWWLLKTQRAERKSIPPATSAQKHASRVVFTPQGCKQGYVYWEVSDSVREKMQQRYGKQLMIRLYDVTDFNSGYKNPPPKHFDCNETTQDLRVSIPVDDRDYIAELGYLTPEGNWLKIAQSTPVRVPACPPENCSAECHASLDAAQSIPVGVSPIAAHSSANSQLQQSVAGEAATSMSAPEQTSRLELYEELDVDSRKHCFHLDPATMVKIQKQISVSRELQPGTYSIKLKSGAFDCRIEPGRHGEPLVLLWLYGGQVINHKTGIEVGSTWSSLNGYDDTLTLDVREPATLCAFFIDTHIEDNEGEVLVTVEGSNPVENLIVHSQENCCRINLESRRRLEQENSISRTLEPGSYGIRIKSGGFNYCINSGHAGEPLVLLWIYGGKVVNRKTGVEVGATWSSLNGYEDVLWLDVREPAILCAFFFDTYLDDNDGVVTLSVMRF